MNLKKIAVFGKRYGQTFDDSVYFFFTAIRKTGASVAIYKPFYDFIKAHSNYDPAPDELFESAFDCQSPPDIVFSIGGDGTFLECSSFVKTCGAPIVGINSGRMGFLANISKEELPAAINAIKKGEFNTQARKLLEVSSEKEIFKEFNYALNEITVQKRDSGSMITIHLYADDNYLNSYWADGLIISTPTGSTAYSLSVGGPIVVPESNVFIITPIAPHNLTVRPIVVPDDVELTVKVEGRSENYMASLDFRTEILDTSTILKLKAADFKVNTVKFDNKTFFDTLRSKLMWGMDKRN